VTNHWHACRKWHATGYKLQVRIEGKKNVKLSLYFLLTEHHAMKAYWGSGIITPRILWPQPMVPILSQMQLYISYKIIN
jgi:hypothetical protein